MATAVLYQSLPPYTRKYNYVAYGDCVVVPLASLLVPAPRYSLPLFEGDHITGARLRSVEALERGWEEITPAKDVVI